MPSLTYRGHCKGQMRGQCKGSLGWVGMGHRLEHRLPAVAERLGNAVAATRPFVSLTRAGGSLRVNRPPCPRSCQAPGWPVGAADLNMELPPLHPRCLLPRLSFPNKKEAAKGEAGQVALSLR